MKSIILITFFGVSFFAYSQNLLQIPPALTGTTFDLNVQTGQIEFYSGYQTPTYGINGPILSSTIVVNKHDLITINVINNLPVRTTMHWHGLHVPAEMDGGPHDIINPGETWSPSFEILNNAGTYWFHPHGNQKTDLHVSKGIAGIMIVHDPEELALDIPHNYGIDDIPLVVQTKAFDVLKQISIADHMDTAIFVNGTINTFANFPAQVVRLRILNGSSMRTFNFGFSNGMNFYQIGTDGGLKGASLQLTRLRLSPGERTEILVDLSQLEGQSFNMMSYASELSNGIFGSPVVGAGNDTIMDYSMNPLNGHDFELMGVNVVSQTSNPILTIPSSLVSFQPYDLQNINANRKLVLDTLRLLPLDIPNLSEGPFGINDRTFNMDSINIRIPLNSKEIWTIINKTKIAHPIHLHDIQFNIIEKNGQEPEEFEKGWKDIILVMPNDSAKFVTQFIDFSDSVHKFMYHCHLLHHEDDGMMGSFIVYDPFANISKEISTDISIYPNPSSEYWNVKLEKEKLVTEIKLYNNRGEQIESFAHFENEIIKINNKRMEEGIYFLKVISDTGTSIIKLLKD